MPRTIGGNFDVFIIRKIIVYNVFWYSDAKTVAPLIDFSDVGFHTIKYIHMYILVKQQKTAIGGFLFYQAKCANALFASAIL